ncbi:HNH endonuclease [Leuconostoc phage CHB]|uniref:HNH endonuclease n=1 Tax=Leuconostoc phage CHB TaxID=1897737 RepID=A0A219VHK8_9CAUD|nr:HNH endonuclease [Leuconostoc phage CHB]
MILMAGLTASHFYKGENMQVNHKDENKINNTLSTLEWVTPKGYRIYHNTLEHLEVNS